MKILLIADVHNRPNSSRLAHDKTLKDIKKAIDKACCDLIVFLGDTVHGPDFKEVDEPYEPYLREVLDLTNGIPFAYVFGNHDDECEITKEEILDIIKTYPNSVTDGRNYVVRMNGETLLFIDSGSYYQGDESYYDVVDEAVIKWAQQEIKDERAILFQHIIVPDIIDCLYEYDSFKPFCARGNGKWVRFKNDFQYRGKMRERPCPPDINNGELKSLSPYLKGAVFGHDHVNSFELDLMGVKLIQCEGAGYNGYDKYHRSSVKILDTYTMVSKLVKL